MRAKILFGISRLPVEEIKSLAIHTPQNSTTLGSLKSLANPPATAMSMDTIGGFEISLDELNRQAQDAPEEGRKAEPPKPEKSPA